MKNFLYLLVIFLVNYISANNIITNEELRSASKFKSSYKASGKPVPMPQNYITTNEQHFIDEQNFMFKYLDDSNVCDVVTLAFYRYHKIIFRPNELFQVRKMHNNNYNNEMNNKKVKQLDALTHVLVNIQSPCEEYPSLESDESYTLEIAGSFASIESKSNWGALRG